MSRRSRLTSCAVGAAVADVAWLAMTGFSQSFAAPPDQFRYQLPVQEPYEATIGRLIECGATEIWLEDVETHLEGQWILEASRQNQNAVGCFERRTVGRGVPWTSY